MPNGEWGPNPTRLWPEDLWTGIKKVLLGPKDINEILQHHYMPNDKSKKPPDLFQVSMSGSTFYIGMDLTKNKPVITDRNPNLEGLVDIHRCIYLPSAYEKNKNPLENSAQKVTFIELPEASVLTPGLAPGFFFVTPKLTGCNIFVAYDKGLHQHWIIRVSAKSKFQKQVIQAPKREELNGLKTKKPKQTDKKVLNRFEAEQLEVNKRKNGVQGTNNFESIGEGNMPKSPNKSNDESSLIADAKQREKEKAATNRSQHWNTNFREFRAYSDCVLDYLRKKGINAKLILRVGTDRDWQMDVRDQKFWVNELDQAQNCKHTFYRGEAIFYAIFMDGSWKFGLKDLGLSLSRVSKMNTFPLIGGQESEINLMEEEEEDNILDDESDTNEDADVMKQEEELSEHDRVLNDFRRASFTLPGEADCENSSDEEDRN